MTSVWKGRTATYKAMMSDLLPESPDKKQNS